MSVVTIILATLLCGLFVVLKDLPIIKGSIQASGAGELPIVKLLAPSLMMTAVALFCISPGELQIPLSNLSAHLSSPQMLTLGIATAISALVCNMVSRFPAVQFAFVGALIGISQASGNAHAWAETAAYLISWIFATLLCAALAAIIYHICTAGTKRSSSNYFRRESTLLKASVPAVLLLAFAYSYNASPLLAVLSGTVSIPGFATPLLAAASLLILYLPARRSIAGASWTIADSDLDVSSESTFSIIISMALVLLLFSLPIVRKIGIAATPLPAGVLFVSALTGISIVRERALVEGEEMLKCYAAGMMSPMLGAITGFGLCRVLSGDPVNIVILLFLVGLLIALAVYFRRQEKQNFRRIVMQSRQQQMYSTQKTLAALEVKAETTEKDLLGKLDIKRQELVDFAVGISEQKKFMEDIYDSISELRGISDIKEKDARTDAILSQLRERMYFTREMNDFYARSEVLHRDFNMRLAEKYPKLTETERKLANLLRQGFSSKYIASLMNITPKSVEISRYRLRAKLGLSRDDNLTQFIKTI
ncbi:MAG: hypothetical protein IJU68_06545 [Bacteroidales bacterium]|nr:hypothetical protein [Bacteroidales bacterium]